MLYDLCVLYLYHNTSNHVAGNYNPATEELKFVQVMIANTLTSGGCRDLVKQLYEKEYISKEKNKKIQKSKTNKEMMAALSKYLKKDKPHIQTALTTAIQSQGVDYLSQVVEGCFSSKNKICLLWIATQWEVLFENKEVVYDVTTNRAVEHIANLEKSGNFWLLHILLRLRNMDAKLAVGFVQDLLVNMKQFVVEFGVDVSTTTSTPSSTTTSTPSSTRSSTPLNTPSTTTSKEKYVATKESITAEATYELNATLKLPSNPPTNETPGTSSALEASTTIGATSSQQLVTSSAIPTNETPAASNVDNINEVFNLLKNRINRSVNDTDFDKREFITWLQQMPGRNLQTGESSKATDKPHHTMPTTQLKSQPQVTQFGNTAAINNQYQPIQPTEQQQSRQSYAEAVQTTSNQSVTIENECVSQVTRKNSNVGNTSSTKPETKQEQNQETVEGKRRNQQSGAEASVDPKKKKSDNKQGKGQKGGKNNRNTADKESQNNDQKSTNNERPTHSSGGDNKDVSKQTNKTSKKSTEQLTSADNASNETKVEVTSVGAWGMEGKANIQVQDDGRVVSGQEGNESIKKETLEVVQSGNKNDSAKVHGQASHGHNLRPRNNGGNIVEQESKPDLVACFDYCQAMETPLDNEENEQVVEFRVLVDKKDKIPEGLELNVFIQGKSFHRMHPDTYIKTGAVVYHFACVFPTKTRQFVYKYVLVDPSTKKKGWENVPQWGHDEVNRVREHFQEHLIPNSHLTFFDVATFTVDGRHKPEFETMYSRNLMDHLPVVQQLSQVPTKDVVLSSLLIQKWIGCASHLAEFKGKYFNGDCNFFPSAKSLLRDYINGISAKGSSEMTKLSVFVSLSAAMAFHKLFCWHKERYQSNPRKDDSDWKIICSGLGLYNMQREEMTSLYQQLQVLERTGTPLKELTQYIWENSKTFPECIFLVPLYYLVENEGNAKVTAEKWEKMENALGLDSLNIREQEPLINICIKIKELLVYWPALVTVYQRLLTCESILKVMKKEKSFEDRFKLELVLEKLASDDYTNKKCIGESKLGEWIERQCNQYIEECTKRTSCTVEETKKAKQSLRKMIDHSQQLLQRACATNVTSSDFQLLQCLSIAAKLIDLEAALAQASTESEFPTDQDFDFVSSKVVGWIKADTMRTINDKYVKRWERLMKVKFSEAKYQERWKEAMHVAVGSKILEVGEGVLWFFVEKLDKLNPSKELQSCFSDAVYEYVSQLSQKDATSWKRFKSYIFESDFQKIAHNMGRLFLNKWGEFGINQFLTFLLEWPFALRFFSLFDTKEKQKVLDRDAKEAMEMIAALMQSTMEALISGDITCKELNRIIHAKSEVIDAWEVITKYHGSSVDFTETELSDAIDQRRAEYKEYERVRGCCQDFTKIAAKTTILRIDTSAMNEALNTNIDDKNWSDIVEVQNNEHTAMKVKLFNLNGDELNDLAAIQAAKLHENEIIFKVWTKHAENAAEQIEEPDQDKDENGNKDDVPTLSLQGMRELIWHPVREELTRLHHQLRQGNLPLCEIEQHLAKYYEKDSDRFKTTVHDFVEAVFNFPLDGGVAHSDADKDLEVLVVQDLVEDLVAGDHVAQGDMDVGEEEVLPAKDQEVVLMDDIHQEDGDDQDEDVALGEEDPNTLDVDAEGLADDPPDVGHEEDVVEELATATQDPIAFEPIEDIEEAVETENQNHTGQKEIEQFSIESASSENLNMKAKEEERLHKEFLQKPLLDQIRYRANQICNYFSIKHQQKTVDIFYDLKNVLALGGDFGLLEIVQNNQGMAETETLNSISQDMIKANKAIDKVTDEMVKFLEDFLKQEELIKWLKENMKDIGEVKVMSDLAMISAGGTPMEVDRVSCFLSAVMTFSSLLFDLNEQSGLTELMGSITRVWESKQNDKSIIEKWKETGIHLAWLNGIKDFHGSVEKSSLSKAQSINSYGIYEIGNATKPISTVDNSIKLVLKGLEKDDQDEEMSLSNLHDLQSRLMLIAGEADKSLADVKHFISVLSHVEKLTRAYVKLKNAGCLLFDKWAAKLRCFQEKAEDNLLSVQFDDKSSVIFSPGEVLVDVQNLTTVLEETHDRWKIGMDEKRENFYHLNHFNVKQTTYLCRELANAHEGVELPDQVHTLLASVRTNITNEEIVNLLGAATKAKDLPLEEDNVDQDHFVDKVELTLNERKKQAVIRLVGEGTSEQLAKAAVQCSGDDIDYDECFLWTMDNEYDDDEEKINELVNQFNHDVGMVSTSSDINVVQSVVDDRSEMSLGEIIQKLSNMDGAAHHGASVAVKTIAHRYIEKTSVTSLSDCISLEHLGNLLESLCDNTYKITRVFHDNFTLGKPNLIVCPPHNIWSTILSLYMKTHDQPLPTTSEVLVCTETTTKEDVELLLRRSVQYDASSDSRIYCMACCEALSYDVANSTEAILKQMDRLKTKNTKYRLVFISSSSKHHLSALFDEYRVDYNIQFGMEEVTKYLEQHLVSVGGESAANVTNNRTVQAVLSDAAGMGKSLHISRLKAQMDDRCHKSTIRFLEKTLNPNDVMRSLQREEIKNNEVHFVHMDITPSVSVGVNQFLFNLLILGSFHDNCGTIWRRHTSHLYCIEYTNLQGNKQAQLEESVLTLLPSVTCLSPREILDGNYEDGKHLLMDEEEFNSETYQRPYQYLDMYTKRQVLDEFKYQEPKGNPEDCLKVLLQYCNIKKPSWSELRHFASFLNIQLLDCERSLFCDMSLVGHDSSLTGFKNFVVRFMIRMSQDFATPSLQLKDTGNLGHQEQAVFELHQLRRRWEENPHPYLFFNEDRVSMSFINFRIDRAGNLLNPQNNTVLERGLIHHKLVRGLELQRVNIQENFDCLSRQAKLERLCKVFGVENCVDPDPTYELTTDNVLKMLAIHMRFRCGIPVVIMGETGCGKTRMVEFMSKLKTIKRKGVENVNNMIIVRVHGGITVPAIQEHARNAIELATTNAKKNVETMLFLDEANTTEAIYAIKEFVCDGTVCGEDMDQGNLKIVAACNPYRKHTEQALKNMEQSGLGFRVKTEDTTDKLGNIPMRQLVYKVIALPPSMQPLVWDFGQLTNEAEKIYILQMVSHLREALNIYLDQLTVNLIVKVFAESQRYMREQREQCSFVSLRDVERCLQCISWFHKNNNWLFPYIQEKTELNLTPMIRSLIHAISMCYYVTLEHREDYLEIISSVLLRHNNALTVQNLEREIIACQEVFLGNITVDEDIARNEALRENVFMIIMCAEMRIPLFLVGKPGSSKSLAKTIVTDAMQGPNARNEMFRKLKQVQVLSFQCSPVSDAVGIEAVFNQCAQLQRKPDTEKFVAVVVLDEFGLAEDSPKMPLKVLHPLLEKGCELKADDADAKSGERFQKVGFVGISNWALDPAKMNRGIFVHRGKPTEVDLKLTAKGIFTSDNKSFQVVGELVEALTQSYLDIKEKEKQEFFGLRDYYGLLKMIFAVVSTNEKRLENYHILNAIVRNFSGGKEDCIQMFLNHLPKLKAIPRMSIQKLVQENLQKGSESRFLLLLTNSFSAINLLSKIANLQDFQVIFGSSFPQDNNYTEVCRNINRIKACMESGATVVLLNLRDLYESLYDALNQHYVTFAGQRYVDLGLGGHRVKCRVSKDFKLIVIEDKNIVYNEFPIPLINRLEKYIFTTESILDGDQKAAAYRLNEWVQHFSAIDVPAHEKRQFKQFTKQDAFVGYIDDSSASAVLVVQDQRNKGATDDNETYNQAQLKLLNTATMDSVFRLGSSRLKEEAAGWQDVYLNQTHDSLSQLLGQQFIGTEDQLKLFEVTSFSKILSDKDKEKLEEKLKLKKRSVTLINLQQFKTEDDYAKHVESFFKHTLMQQPQDEIEHWVLLIQCPQADAHGNLIACAKYSIKNCIQNNLRLMREKDCLKVCVAFLYTMERQSNELVGNKLMGIHSSDYTLVHVDELRMSTDYIGPPSQFWNKSIHKVMDVSYKAFELGDKSDALVDMEVLVKKSIPQAMLKLQSDSTAHQQNLIHELASLCSSKHEVGQHFLPHMLKYMVKILQEREISDFRRPWYVREAMSHTSLSEGGTLQKTLWLSLKNTTENILAYIISKIDSDQNLNLLLQEMESKNEQNQMRDLWMSLFILPEISDFKSHGTVGKAATYKIEGSIHFAGKFPFSRRLCGIFNQSWEALVQTGVGNMAEMFMELQTKSALNRPILDALNHKMGTVLKHYLHDMIHLYHKSDNPLEYDVIQQAFLEMCTASHDPNIVSNPVFRAFTLMKQSTSALNQFSLLVSLFPGVLDKGNVKRCQEDQANKCQLMLPVTAFRIVVTQMNVMQTTWESLKNTRNGQIQ
uniref:LOW QUALITY PROTEIN: E3 ubiquitin-protein ligase rnf213-alpha-like n=1 Tax=Ciona intestinalis TaxID=7719 RepID=UPI00089DB262|nr:LOW QUALITY PROTEIN: E3 ubiquitin-protein ligase rnf213-alpha-like [Ciona intestinalis]|eukprot:XP_018671622.1 LOW QUALITY PROTEIN: E3 ubiquitin-protein ligase rnf213-alpha-like [Ciona intestinalis]